MNGSYQIGDVVFGNWVIKEKIGEGSFGKVFGIERNDFGHTYKAALKVITVPQNDAELQMALDEGMDEEDLTQHFYGAVEEIVQEFYLMSKVKGSSHVVGYEDHTVIPHTQGIGWDILIRMERLTPLLTWAFAHPMSRRDIIQVGIHLCSALELCQKHQILHRDIKPENIFVSDSGDYKLGDFGVARTMEKTMSGMSKKGTYNYMAPEVYKGEEYGFRADMYSVGIVLYRLLNHNRIPFLPPAPERVTMRDRETALNRRIQGEKLPLPVFAQDALGQIVCKAAAPVPADRFESPAQMRKALEDVLFAEKEDAPIYPDAKEQKKRQEGSITLNNMNRASAVPDMSATPVMGGHVDTDEQEDTERTVSAWDRPQNTSQNTNKNHFESKPVNQEIKIDAPVNIPEKEENWEDATEKTTSAFATPKKQPGASDPSPKVPTRKVEESKPVPAKKQKKKPGIVVFLLAALAVVSIVMGIAYVATTKQEANDERLEAQWSGIAQPIWEDVYGGLVLGSGSKLNYIINPFEDINQALTRAGFSGLAKDDFDFSDKVNSSYDEYDIRITMKENYEKNEWTRQLTVSKESVFFKTEGVASYYDAQKRGVVDRVLPDVLIIGETTPMDLGITEEMIQWVYKDDMDFRIAEDGVWKVNASIYSRLNPEELRVSAENIQGGTTKELIMEFRKLEQGWVLAGYDITFFVGQPGGSGEIGMHGENVMDTIWDQIQKDLTGNSGSVLDFTTASMSEILMRFDAAGFSDNYFDEVSKIGVYHKDTNISFYMTEGQSGGVTTRRISINPNSGYRLQDAQSVTYYEDADLGKVDAVLPMGLRVGTTTLEDLGISEEWVLETTDFATPIWDATVYVVEYDGGHQVEIYASEHEGNLCMDLIFCKASQGYVLLEMTVEFPVE